MFLTQLAERERERASPGSLGNTHGFMGLFEKELCERKENELRGLSRQVLLLFPVELLDLSYKSGLTWRGSGS